MKRYRHEMMQRTDEMLVNYNSYQNTAAIFILNAYGEGQHEMFGRPFRYTDVSVLQRKAGLNNYIAWAAGIFKSSTVIVMNVEDVETISFN